MLSLLSLALPSQDDDDDDDEEEEEKFLFRCCFSLFSFSLPINEWRGKEEEPSSPPVLPAAHFFGVGSCFRRGMKRVRRFHKSSSRAGADVGRIDISVVAPVMDAFWLSEVFTTEWFFKKYFPFRHDHHFRRQFGGRTMILPFSLSKAFPHKSR